jgi:N-acetylmuramoyl-L-alanine amidase
LDNGHGINTPGKRSPVWDDGSQFFEWEFNRDIVARVANFCSKRGLQYHILVPEHRDIPLRARIKRANDIYMKNRNSVLISVHADAYELNVGHGFSIYTSPEDDKSDRIANMFFPFYVEEFPEHRARMDLSDGDADFEQPFAILEKVKCPAILLENFFYTHEVESKLLMTNEFRQRIANTIIKGMLKVEGIL